MTTREKALKLVMELPESQLDPLIEFLQPQDELDDAAAKREALDHLRRIANGEDDGYDFAVSESLHALR